MFNNLIQSVKDKPRLALGALAGIMLVVVIVALVFTRSTSGQPENVVTKGVPQPAREVATEPSKETETAELTAHCEGEECVSSEEEIYAKARVAAQRIADAQNNFARLDPNDTDGIENNQRIIDKYLSGLDSYSIDGDGARLMSKARAQWLATTQEHTWVLEPDTDQTRYNALIERGLTLVCVSANGEILSEVFLGWGDPTGSTELKSVVDKGKYPRGEEAYAQSYLTNEYVSFTYFQQVITDEGARALGYDE